MANLTEEEALKLVAVRGHCDDLDTWERIPARDDIWELKSGLIDVQDIRRDQSIHLRVYRSAAPAHSLSFHFTLFHNTKLGQERIYQLEVHFGKKQATSRHQRSHEHVGSARREAQPEWATWCFAQALAHFCQRTNIYLNPVPSDPLLPTKEKQHAHRHR